MIKKLKHAIQNVAAFMFIIWIVLVMFDMFF